jgi:UDP-N-acetylmuramate--alanine ligase
MFNQFEAQTSGVTVRGNSVDVQDMERDVPMLGKHNLENACCAVQLCTELGMDEDQVRAAVARFKGIERRLEIVGKVEGVTIIDDYAHNPAKIAAALSTAADAFGTVHAFWRPHGFTPLFQGLEELVEVFSSHWKKAGGTVFILPVFYAGGMVERRATSEDLVERIQTAGVPARLVPDYASLKGELERCAARGDAIFGMGARDPELPVFAKRLVAEWKKS